MTKNIVRRGNRRGGVFIAYEDARRYGWIVWLASFCAVDTAKKAMAMYKKYGEKAWRRLALKELAKARECRELCMALSAPRMVYREERP